MKREVTESVRTEYRRALQRCGVPDVYAFMAARELTVWYSRRELAEVRSADSLLACGFIWDLTEEGHAFWWGIEEEASL